MNTKVKIFIIIIVSFVIGISIGFFIGNKLNSNNKTAESKTKDTKFIDDIKNSSYNNENMEKTLDELKDLYNQLNSIESEKINIEAKITQLENRVNTATDYEFEDEIYDIDQNEIDEANNNQEEISNDSVDNVIEQNEDNNVEETQE